MTNSPLVDYTLISPNKTENRKYPIDRITPHCVVGQCSVETLGNVFAPASRQASSNYEIGYDGKVGMYCEEKDRSWCSSSAANDHRAVTIECASDTTAPYAFRDVVYEKLIELCADICKRNGKAKLLWLGDKDKTLAYTPAADEMVLTVHRWFANKSCPGDWMYSRMGDLAAKVTDILQKEEGSLMNLTYRVQVGAAFTDVNEAVALGEKLIAAGFECFIVAEGIVDMEVTPDVEPEVEPTIQVGSRVKVKPGAKTYTGGSVASFVYNNVYPVDELVGDRAVLDKRGICTPFNVKDLILQ